MRRDCFESKEKFSRKLKLKKVNTRKFASLSSRNVIKSEILTWN